MNKISHEYKLWITQLKNKIRSSQVKASLIVNSVLIEFYWELGKIISEKENIWGSKLIEQVAKDLKEDFPNMKGLSVSNLKYCRQFYNFYKNELEQKNTEKLEKIDNQETQISQQLVGQFTSIPFNKIPWSHNILIISKVKDIKEAEFYIHQTIENNWSRDVLGFQIKSNLYKRIGKSVTNFKYTLPEPMSDLAQQTLKDPYIFDFLTMSEPYHEKDIENQLIQHVTKFLLELGKGFAFVGQQYHLEIAGNDYYLDLLFYHIKLKCYVVIELKNTKFIPEYAGKLNFYLSAVDTLLKEDSDKPTIGLLLCRDKNNIEVEFSLRDINKPMGISEFEITEILPDNLKSSLPTIEEIENRLKK